jgi:hypothetical protein
MAAPAKSALTRFRRDPVAFIRQVLVDPETSKPFVLYPAEERFLREALTLTSDGRLPYPELIFSAPKKSGKTTVAALVTLCVVVLFGGPYSEGFACANDFDQAAARVYQAITRIIEASPLLKDSATITANKITFASTGASITALASDFAGAAGANPNISTFDELWGFVSERSRRLFDEMVPPPTRKVATRLTVTYAGYSGESELLEELYKRGLKGEEIAPSLYSTPGKLLMFWSHEPVAPWQTLDWIEQMRSQLRPNAFLRLIQNQWVTSESTFIPIEWWDRCVDQDLSPELTAPSLSVFVGVDASVKRDSTAIAVCSFDAQARKVKLIWHRTFQPTPDAPLDFEDTIETTLLGLRRRFNVREIRFDPFQLVAVAQRLTAAGLPMIEFPQSVPNLTEASTNLYEVIKGRNLIAYPDDDIRLAVSRAVAIETSRGWRIGKEKQSHKIDVVVALAQAALGAVQGGQVGYGMDPDFQARAAASIHEAARARLSLASNSNSQTTGERWAAEMDAADARRSKIVSHRWGRQGTGF